MGINTIESKIMDVLDSNPGLMGERRDGNLVVYDHQVHRTVIEFIARDSVIKVYIPTNHYKDYPGLDEFLRKTEYKVVPVVEEARGA